MSEKIQSQLKQNITKFGVLNIIGGYIIGYIFTIGYFKFDIHYSRMDSSRQGTNDF